MDPDVERLLREDMHRHRRSFKQSLNTAVRTGLHATPGQELPPFEIKARDLGPLLIDVPFGGFNKLNDNLQTIAVLERMRAFEAEGQRLGRVRKKRAGR